MGVHSVEQLPCPNHVCACVHDLELLLQMTGIVGMCQNRVTPDMDGFLLVSLATVPKQIPSKTTCGEVVLLVVRKTKVKRVPSKPATHTHTHT